VELNNGKDMNGNAHQKSLVKVTFRCMIKLLLMTLSRVNVVTVISFQAYLRLRRNPKEFNKYSYKIRLIRLAVMQSNFLFVEKRKQLLWTIDSRITQRRKLGPSAEQHRAKRFGF